MLTSDTPKGFLYQTGEEKRVMMYLSEILSPHDWEYPAQRRILAIISLYRSMFSRNLFVLEPEEMFYSEDLTLNI